MTQENDNKKRRNMCQCRSCGTIFHSSKNKKINRLHSGIHINDCSCPKCGSVNFGLMDSVYIKSDRWLYTDAKNYGDIDKYLKRINYVL